MSTHCAALRRMAIDSNTLQHAATHCTALRHTAIDCNTLQRQVVFENYTSLLQKSPIKETIFCPIKETIFKFRPSLVRSLQRARLCHTHGNTLQHTATHCNTLQHTATHCNTLRRIAPHANWLQHTTTPSLVQSLQRARSCHTHEWIIMSRLCQGRKEATFPRQISIRVLDTHKSQQPTILSRV